MILKSLTSIFLLTLAVSLYAEEQEPPGSLLFAPQEVRDVAFRTVSDLLPTREIKKGDYVLPMPAAPRDLHGVAYEVEGESFTLADFLARRETRGFLVWKDGKVLLEHYHKDHNADTRWVSFSVAKSVTALLIGVAIKDGYIKSVDEPVTNYVSRFKGTGYADATIKDVMQMASGVAWNEDYDDPTSDVSRAGSFNGLPLLSYLSGLEKVAPPGTKFNYNTGETNLAGEVLRAAIGNNASTYLTHKIWQPFGMESDATWMLGSPGGGETGGCCINATLRDYARIGIFALNDGKLRDGSSPLPDGWMAESIAPSRGSEGYGYFWWLDADGPYRARGIFGQQIYINPETNVVIALHGSAGKAVGSEYHAHIQPAVDAAAAAAAAD